MTPETSSTLARCAVSEGIARLTLNRPQKRNAINGDLMRELAAHVDRLADDAGLRAVVIDAEGPMFSAGIDLGYASGLLGASGAAADLTAFHEEVALLQGTITRIARLPVPIVAALHGACIGLGLELALAADVRLAAEGCRFALPESVLGLVADCGGTTRLSGSAGLSWAGYLLMTGETLDAADARMAGVVHEVLPAERLAARTDEVAGALARRNPMVMRQFKRLLQLARTAHEDAMLAEEIVAQEAVLTTPDFGQHLMAGIQEMMSRKR